jgi:hypothetical protein
MNDLCAYDAATLYDRIDTCFIPCGSATPVDGSPDGNRVLHELRAPTLG